MTRPRRIDAETVARVRLLMGQRKTYAMVAQEAGLSVGSVAGICARNNIFSEYVAPPQKSPPESFAAEMATMNVMMAARHYRVSKQTLRRWLKETGITPATFYPVAKPKAPKSAHIAAFTPSYRAPRRTTGMNGYLRHNVPQRDASPAASAQLFLQRYGPVIRARTVDRLAPKWQWIVHGRRMSETDMIAAATRKGWGAAA